MHARYYPVCLHACMYVCMYICTHASMLICMIIYKSIVLPFPYSPIALALLPLPLRDLPFKTKSLKGAPKVIVICYFI